MQPIELTTEERTVTAETLKSCLGDLSYEISNTDNFDFRQGLKHKAEILTRVIKALDVVTEVK